MTKFKPKPKRSARTRGPVRESVIEEGIKGVASGQQKAGFSMLLGPPDPALTRVAFRATAVAAAAADFETALSLVIVSGDSAARLVLRKHAKTLTRELSRAAGESPDIADDVAEASRTLKETVAKAGLQSGTAASRRPVSTWWDRIRKLSCEYKDVATALHRFQDAAATGHRATIEGAAEALITTITKRVTFGKAKEFRKRLNGAVRRLTSEQASIEGGKALVALYNLVDGLAPGDPLRAALGGLIGAVRANPDRWFSIANVVAGMRRAKSEGEALAMTWRIQGALGEMLAFSTFGYRQLYRAGLRDAEALARRLNEGLPEPEKKLGKWKIQRVRTQVRAPQVDSSRLARFYDDAIIVYRTVADSPEGEAIVVFAAQVKSGDWSSAGVIKQIHHDIRRELGGVIEVDGRQYRLRAGPGDFPPTRVFVGTLLPPAEAVAALRTQVHTVILSKGGDDLKTLARGLLEANGLLP